MQPSTSSNVFSVVPGPRANRWVSTARWLHSAHQFLRGAHGRYGDTFSVELAQFGPIVFFGHPEAVEEIFKSDPEVLKAGEGNESLRFVFGDSSILMLDGHEHLRQRKLLMPPFHGKRLHGIAEQMRAVTASHIEDWRRDEVFSLQPHMLTITRRVIFQTVFGIDDHLGPLSAALESLLALLSGPLAPFLVTPPLRRDLGPLSPWGHFKRVRGRVDRLLFEHIARRRATHGEETHHDMMEMLLDARDEQGEGMIDQELRDELITLLLAGHETTATAMTWVFERILQRPDVVGALRDELDAVLDGREISGPDLKNLKYMNATLQEVLRTRPIIGIVLRQASEDVAIQGIRVPAGTRVGVSIARAHHHPTAYEDPEAFRPERFLDVRPNPYAWLPFGGGTRRCIGRTFALFQMKMMLATILREYHLEPEDRGPLSIVQRGITQAPAKGTRVRAYRRS